MGASSTCTSATLVLGLELTMQSHLYTPMSSGMNISTTEPVSSDPSGGTSSNSSETVRPSPEVT